MTRNQFKNYLGGEEGVLAQTFPQLTEDPYKTALDVLGRGWKYVKKFIFGNYDVNVRFANSEQIGRVLERNGGRKGRVNLGAYVEDTDEIIVNPDSARWGYDPLKIALHEGAHWAKSKGLVRLPDHVEEERWADAVADNLYRTVIGGVKGFI